MTYTTRHSPVVLQALLFGSALLAGGCAGRGGSEVDYTYEVLKKAPDGSVQVVGKGTSRKTTSGEAGGFEYAEIGSITTGARKISEKSAAIEITYPDKTTGTVEVGSGETKEHFHSGGAYGVRITVEEIRFR